METVSFAVSVVGLAGLFSVCLDAVERFDAWKKFDADLEFLGVRVEAERLRLDKWGQAVGFKQDNVLGGTDNDTQSHHHSALDDKRTAAMVKKLMTLLRAVCSGQDGFLLSETHTRGGRPALNHFGVSSTSKRARVKWALKDKATCMAQVEQVELLVQKLHDLVPPFETKTSLAPRQLLDSLNDVLADKEQFRSTILKIERSLNTEVRRDLHAWLLGRHAPNEIFEQSLRQQLENTCLWIMERREFLDWVSSNFPSRCAKSLWIHGPAGFGKTFLCASLIRYLRSILKTPVAYYFFSSDFESRKDPFAAVRSWLVHLSSDPAVFDFLRDKWESSEGTIAFTADIVTSFKEAVRMFPDCTLVIDGLDECGGDEAHREDNTSMAAFLTAIRDAISGTNTRILITSRDEVDIRQGLMKTAEITSTEYKILPRDLHADIGQYSRKLVDEKLAKTEQNIRQELCQKMTDRCEGQFLWVKLQGSNLKSWKNKTQLETAIDKAPSGLELLYQRKWDRISSLGQEESERAFDMLKWVTFAVRPMTVAELAEALLIDLTREDILIDDLPDFIEDDYIDDEILRISASFLETQASLSGTDAALQTVHFTHFSAKQYFLSRISERRDTLMANERLRSSVELACINEIATKCLHYINMPHVWEGLGPDAHSVHRSFRNYAASSWYKYAAASDHDEVTRRSNDFFALKNDTWKRWRHWFALQEAFGNSEGIVVENPLYYASRFNLVATAQHLLAIGAGSSNEMIRRYGITILSLMCGFGLSTMVTTLLDAGADVHIHSGKYERTALHEACQIGHVQMTRELLKRGAVINALTSMKETPILLAASMGHGDLVALLLEYGADPSVADNIGELPLHWASKRGFLQVVRVLLEKGHRADINHISRDGWSPLSLAALFGHVDIVKLLLHFGANLSGCNHKKQDVLQNSADPNQTDFTRVLSSTGQKLPLHFAAKRGHFAIVKLLLEEDGSEVNASDPVGWTAIHFSSDAGHLNVTQLLLDCGADISMVDVEGCTPLHLAACEGHEEVVCLLLSHEADISMPNTRGCTPLHVASGNGHVNVVHELCEYDFDAVTIDAAASGGETPISLAAGTGHVEVVKVLLKHNADVDKMDKGGWRPVLSACFYGHLDIVKVLFDAGADFSVMSNDRRTVSDIASDCEAVEIMRFLREKGLDIAMVNGHGYIGVACASAAAHSGTSSPLLEEGAGIPEESENSATDMHQAVSRGDLDAIQLLLEKNADVSALDAHRATPLHYAVYGDNIKAARLLLDHDANPYCRADVDGNTPMVCAILAGKLEIVRAFCEAQEIASDIDQRETLLHIAARLGHMEIVTEFLHHNHKLGQHGRNGRSALHGACASGQLAVAQLCLDRGADVDLTDKLGNTSLLLAAQNGHTEIVRLCIEAGASLDACNMRGYTPLVVASGGGHTEIVNLLLEQGAKVQPCRSKAVAALISASNRGQIAVVGLLLANGCDIEARNSVGKTPLLLASAGGHEEVVSLLLEHGADVEAVDMDGATSLHHASLQGHLSTVSVLLQTGCAVHTKDKRGKTALHYASNEGMGFTSEISMFTFDEWLPRPSQSTGLPSYAEITAMLIESGADVDDVCSLTVAPIHLASQMGNIEAVKCLIDAGADITAEDMHGQTALHHAIIARSAGTVELLLDSGADANRPIQKTKGTPLIMACKSHQLALVTLLIQHGADVTARDALGGTPLLAAATGRNAAIIDYLLRINPSLIHDSDHLFGRQALGWAALHAPPAVVQALLRDPKLDPDARDRYGQTAFSFAVRLRRKDIAQALLASGRINALARDNLGRTPLSWAAAQGCSNMDDFVSARGGDKRGEGVMQADASEGAASQADASDTVGEQATEHRFKYCDVCRFLIPKKMGFCMCRKCYHGHDSFDICDTCYHLGARCGNPEHELEFILPGL